MKSFGSSWIRLPSANDCHYPDIITILEDDFLIRLVDFVHHDQRNQLRWNPCCLQRIADRHSSGQRTESFQPFTYDFKCPTGRKVTGMSNSELHQLKLFKCLFFRMSIRIPAALFIIHIEQFLNILGLGDLPGCRTRGRRFRIKPG